MIERMRLVELLRRYFYTPPGNRLAMIDCTRGFAVWLMMVFHFCFLLKEFRLAFLDFASNDYWQALRIIIVVTFLTLVGMSLKIASTDGLNTKRYTQRLLQLLIYGTALSFTTYLIASHRTVYFGILQFILVASILGLFFVRLHWLNLLVGILILYLGFAYQNSLFNHDYLWWLGMVTQYRVTLDYVPLFPWFGCVLIGLFLGHYLVLDARLEGLRQWQPNRWYFSILDFTGRHSLDIYMLHVPAFFILIYFYTEVFVV